MELKDCKEGLPVVLLEKPHQLYIVDAGAVATVSSVLETHVKMKINSGCAPKYKGRVIGVCLLENWAILENKEK